MARKISMRQAINEALDQEMSRDPSVIVMGEDIVGGMGGDGEKDAWGGALGVTKGLYAKHGSWTRPCPNPPISGRLSGQPPAACARWRN